MKQLRAAKKPARHCLHYIRWSGQSLELPLSFQISLGASLREKEHKDIP
jgi:hypothetical protein